LANYDAAAVLGVKQGVCHSLVFPRFCFFKTTPYFMKTCQENMFDLSCVAFFRMSASYMSRLSFANLSLSLSSISSSLCIQA
jgi:hypothetical protein